jgi:hypothetical protein
MTSDFARITLLRIIEKKGRARKPGPVMPVVSKNRSDSAPGEDNVNNVHVRRL